MTNLLESITFPRRTDRLTIRRATVHDVALIASIRAIGAVSDWLTVDASDRPRIEASFRRPERLAVTMVIELDDTVIGDLMCRESDCWAQAEVVEDAAGAQAELGWVLDPAHAGHGYATEAVDELLLMGFEELGLRRVVASCFADNEASWRLMERVGMRRETHTRADSLHRSGRWLDSFGYAILAEEWRRRRPVSTRTA